jgi:hypothetical protein
MYVINKLFSTQWFQQMNKQMIKLSFSITALFIVLSFFLTSEVIVVRVDDLTKPLAFLSTLCFKVSTSGESTNV